MNGGLKHLFERVFMNKLVDKKIIGPNPYVSIPGNDPIEAMEVLYYTYDNHKIQRKDLVIIFNVAAGCYNCIRANQAEICARRVRCAKSLTKLHTRMQLRMRHRIKTSAGVSKGRIEQISTKKSKQIEKVEEFDATVHMTTQEEWHKEMGQGPLHG